MRTVQLIVDIVTTLAALIALILLTDAFRPEISAPQQGAIAALAAAIVIIPYCLSATIHRAQVRHSLRGGVTTAAAES